MTWSQTVQLLDILVEIGLVEPGFASASIERGATRVRLPWVRKGDWQHRPPTAVERTPMHEYDHEEPDQLTPLRAMLRMPSEDEENAPIGVAFLGDQEIE